MTRTLYTRDSLFMRVVSAVVAISFTLSLAGTGFAAPPPSEPDPSDPALVAEAPVADADTPVVSVEPVEGGAPSSVEAEPTTAEPGTGGVQDEPVSVPAGGGSKKPSAKSGGESITLLSAASLTDAPFNKVSWEAWRLSPKAEWIKANLGEYKEGDWIPVRIVIDNTSGSGAVRVPAFHTAWDYLNTNKNAIAVDGARDFYFYAGTSLPGDQPYAAGAQNIGSYFSEYADGNGQYYNVVMGAPASDLVIPQGQVGAVYFQVHLALTQYWQGQSPARLGAKEYPGSSAQGRFISWAGGGVGDNTISVPVGQQVTPEGRINGVKFHDLNRDGVKQSGEPGLSGWEFTLTYGGEFPFTATTLSGSGGVFTFSTLPAGQYTLGETLVAPWANSTPLPMSFALARDEVRAVQIGNYVPDLTKTWSLSIDTLPMGATAFVRYSVNGGAPVTTNLTGSSPYTAAVQVPHGVTISGIGFYVLYQGSEVLLGTMPNETLTANKTNSFTYDSRVSGKKFDAGTGEGLSGWTIVLKRVSGSVESTYAIAVTGAGGSYSFEDVLPGTYAVYEVQQPGWINTVSPTGTFAVSNGSVISGKDFGNLFISSSISIVKSGVAQAHVGDVVPYSIVVKNTGNFTLTNVTVTDAMLGLNRMIGSLAPAQEYTIEASHTVLASDPDPLPNTAHAAGTTVFGGTVMAHDDHVVDILKPAIAVVKTASPEMAVNPAGVTYTYVVTNVGEDPLRGVALTDDKLSVPGGGIGALAVGQSVTLTASATLTSTTTNVATASGADALGKIVSATDDAIVRVFNPSISIVKSASSSVVLPNGMVTYTYLVTNTGDVSLFDIAVVDDVLGPVGTIGALAPLASDTVTAIGFLEDDTTNIGTATGWYGTPETEFYGSVTDSDPEAVVVVDPKVRLIKTGAPSPVRAGGSVTYTYEVTNIGDVALYDLVVVDDKLGDIGTIPMLPVGATSSISTVTVLTQTTTNLGEVSGYDQYRHPVYDSDPETVVVYNPAISIDKSVDRSRVVAGKSVTYTFLVKNEGDIELRDIAVADDKLGAIGTIAVLAPGATSTLTKSAVITADVTNLATATGSYGTPDTPFFGTVTDDDSAFVDAINPGIDVQKSASAGAVLPGTTVTYTFVVTNTGDSTLYDIVVTDNHVGLVGTVESLAPQASVTLTKSAVLTATTTNVVVARGHDEFENPYSDSDAETVAVVRPGIAIVKTASPATVLAGGSVTYTYTVTNTGDVTLTNVAVTDDKLGSIGTIAVLAPGAPATLTRTTAITADTVNVGVAVGTYTVPGGPSGTVSASDDAAVDVVAPAIGIVKTVSSAEIVLGETVTYTFTVTNTGDVELINVTITDDKLGDIGTIPSLLRGASMTFTRSAAPTEDTTNIATATGTDRFGNQVSATDDASVEVGLPFTPGDPDMSIEKSANKTEVEAGDRVTYTLTYRNVGEGDAVDIVITDDFDERYMSVVDAGGGTVAGGVITWRIGGPLSPEDGAKTITYTLKVADDLPESVARIDNVVRVSAPDDKNPDNDTDTWRVEIPEPFLPFTGGEFGVIGFGAFMALALGAFLRRLGRQVS